MYASLSFYIYIYMYIYIYIYIYINMWRGEGLRGPLRPLRGRLRGQELRGITTNTIQ